jgi:hypothetical protein
MIRIGVYEKRQMKPRSARDEAYLKKKLISEVVLIECRDEVFLVFLEEVLSCRFVQTMLDVKFLD